eukprot:IDg9787t1
MPDSGFGKQNCAVRSENPAQLIYSQALYAQFSSALMMLILESCQEATFPSESHTSSRFFLEACR